MSFLRRFKIRNLTSRVFAGSLPLILTAIGTALRLVPWLANYPLHRDEALYGAWARLIASGADPLLLTVWVDKPPLALYALAGSLRLFGVSELALRLPGVIASILTIPLVYGLARRAYGQQTALLATVLFAASPFAILFAPTAFTDPFLTLWLMVAAWAALARRPFWAGLGLGLAVASKQQGVLGVPLVVGLLGLRQQSRHLLSAILGVLVIFVPVTYWDSLRWTNRPSFWDRSLATYGRLGLAPATQWPARAAAWAEQLGYLYGLPALSVLLLGLAAWVGIRAWRPLAARPTGGLGNRRAGGQVSSFPPGLPLAEHVDLVIGSYIASYLALHILLTFQPWDRYLLPVVPLVSILAARGLTLIFFRTVAHAARTATADENLDHEAAKGHEEHEARRTRRAVRDASRFVTFVTLRVFVIQTPFWPAVAFFRTVIHAGRGATAYENVILSGFTSQSPPRTQQSEESLDCVRDSSLVSRRGVFCASNPLRVTSDRAIFRTALGAGLALLLAWATWLGAAGRLPVGSDHGAYVGLERVVATLREQPAEAVIYHHSLGWHFDFYLFNAPQERRWWDTGWKLADDAARTARLEPGRPQWLVLPGWEDEAAGEIRLALASRGLVSVERERIYRLDGSRSFTIYQIVPVRG